MRANINKVIGTDIFHNVFDIYLLTLRFLHRQSFINVKTAFVACKTRNSMFQCFDENIKIALTNVEINLSQENLEYF